ncbi:MAG: 2'-5' RNA ligase family protein [Candidatus Ozemobacteraceae bacterium]
MLFNCIRRHSRSLLGTVFLAIIFFFGNRGGSLFAIDASAISTPEHFTKGASEAKLLNLNVFAAVSASIEAQAQSASRLLEEYVQLQSFSRKGFQVHCTLYMTRFPAERLASVTAIIKEVAGEVKPFKAFSEGVFRTTNDWLFVNLRKTRDLQLLSDHIVTLLSPLRSNDPHIPAWAKSMPEKVEKIKLYGSPNVFDQFAPHLTLLAKTDAALLDTFMATATARLDLTQPIDGEIISIGVGEADGNGQVAKSIAIFPLSSNVDDTKSIEKNGASSTPSAPLSSTPDEGIATASH